MFSQRSLKKILCNLLKVYLNCLNKRARIIHKSIIAKVGKTHNCYEQSFEEVFASHFMYLQNYTWYKISGADHGHRLWYGHYGHCHSCNSNGQSLGHTLPNKDILTLTAFLDFLSFEIWSLNYYSVCDKFSVMKNSFVIISIRLELPGVAL